MTFTIVGLILYVLIAAICGAIGRAIVGETRGGLIVSIAVGFIGAMFGPWIAHQAGLPEPFTVHIGGESFPILWSIVGSALFVAIISLISRVGQRPLTT